MKHMIRGRNVGIVYRRQMPEGETPTYFFISNDIISDGYIKSDNKGSETIAPLYLYHDDGERTSNLRAERVRDLAINLGRRPSDEDVFDYIYGVFHSNVYRSKFKELLKDDFPRVPVPADDEEFESFRGAGEELRGLHLMVDPAVDDFVTSYPRAGDHVVRAIRRVDDQVWINDTQYFGGVSDDVWNFIIGAYKPAQKWLEQRKGRALTGDEID
ncbi:type ISP restriction/modification enzyme, partial [Saccharothrix longispora]|uniref:type ISP restriction/modification enzyme n=1 Tax=Saccharothrix longispora TaxID=33920 RepID=UPI0028FD4D24